MASMNHDTALGEMRPDLLRFARLQLRNPELAEDVVQEALLAACADRNRFENRSSLKTWVFGILRHKIVDLLRSRGREVAASELAEDGAGDEALAETLFDVRGHWQPEATPGRWRDPEDSFAQAEFWAIFEACLDRLPEKTARVFSLREILGFETGEICDLTNCTPSHCGVLLHRARLSLRTCLAVRWFQE